MVVELTPAEVDELLASETIGRVTWEQDGQPCVVPVTYHYEGAELLVHTDAGRSLPAPEAATSRVCFEVDRVLGLSRWQTLMAWGRCESAEGRTWRLRLDERRGFIHVGSSH